MPGLFIGTSGWNYPHWGKGVFYPKGIAKVKWLEYYAQFFNSVELNVTFYRLLPEKNFKEWYRRTPVDFHFVAKGSRFITHIKRLKDVRSEVKMFVERVLNLKKKLGCLLWQLPPAFKKDLRRLESLLELLKSSHVRQAFEFRNISWFDQEVYDLLRRYNACLCIAHSGSRFPCEKEMTADFTYLRFHGEGALYSSRYSDRELKEWAAVAKKHRQKDVFAFFNNDAYGYAVENASRFRELLEK
ncbi:MAG: hypothetical protein AMJ95_10430 [Omnitrophica WOR_2 bacterium SM23_72]|nr:MAG: hypothetical protein AMJ95_10430 [Omnitrophica WOR_2 bacterium SM23_72]